MAHKFFQVSLASVLLFADLGVDVGYKVPPSFYGKDIALLFQHGIGFLDRIRIEGKVDGKRPHGRHLTPGGEDPFDDQHLKPFYDLFIEWKPARIIDGNQFRSPFLFFEEVY